MVVAAGLARRHGAGARSRSSRLAVAVLGASFTGCRARQRTGARCPTGPTPSAYALQSIPPERLRLYEQAGARFDIDWIFLASIGAQECGNGDCAGVNSSGCAGPMQIAYVRGQPVQPRPRADVVGTLRRQRAPRAGTEHQRSGGRDLHRRADPPARHGRPADRRHLRRIPPGRLPLLRRVRRRDRRLRRRGDGPRRAVRVHRHRLPSQRQARRSRNPSASGEMRVRARSSRRSGQQLADRARSPKARSARASTQQAPTARSTGRARSGAPCSPRGSGSTPACRFPAPPPHYGYSGVALHLGQRTRRQGAPGDARRPRRATPSSTAPGRAKARTSGSSRASSRTGEIDTVEGNYANHVTRVGPFQPANATSDAVRAAPIYGYAQPPAHRRHEAANRERPALSFQTGLQAVVRRLRSGLRSAGSVGGWRWSAGLSRNGAGFRRLLRFRHL